MQAALAMLARRSQPAARVSERITEAFSARDAERTVARLIELGVLDDSAYAQAFVRDRFVRRGYGRDRIRADLRARGVAALDIDAAFVAIIDPQRERAAAEHAYRRFCRLRAGRSRRTGEDDARRMRDAAFRHLSARGFPVDVVRELLDGALPGAEPEGTVVAPMVVRRPRLQDTPREPVRSVAERARSLELACRAAMQIVRSSPAAAARLERPDPVPPSTRALLRRLASTRNG